MHLLAQRPRDTDALSRRQARPEARVGLCFALGIVPEDPGLPACPSHPPRLGVFATAEQLLRGVAEIAAGRTCHAAPRSLS